MDGSSCLCLRATEANAPEITNLTDLLIHDEYKKIEINSKTPSTNRVNTYLHVLWLSLETEQISSSCVFRTKININQWTYVYLYNGVCSVKETGQLVQDISYAYTGKQYATCLDGWSPLIRMWSKTTSGLLCIPVGLGIAFYMVLIE